MLAEIPFFNFIKYLFFWFDFLGPWSWPWGASLEAIEKATAVLAEIAVANPSLLTGGQPLALVAPHVENIGHAASIEATDRPQLGSGQGSREAPTKG